MRLLILAILTVSACHAEQPNILVLLADDLGYGELGCQGNSQIPTPHIDSLARDGVRFTSAYVTAPNCSPSRAGLLTGRIPTRFGYEFNPIGAKNEQAGIGLPANEKTLAEVLHDVGYTTGIVGKWHLGGSAEFHPHRHGFDEFFGFNHEGHYFVPPPYDGVTTMLRRKSLPENQQGRWEGEKLIYTTHMGHDEPDYDANNPVVRDGQPVIEDAYLTDAFARESVDFVQRHQDKPWFLYVAWNAVHSPLQGKDADMEKFADIEDVHRRIFASMLSSLDEGVGSILKAVKDTGQKNRTIVIFLSDNGGPTRELTSSNLPLRGEKGSMYEGGLRVPMLVRWPGIVPPGRVNETPVSSLDVFATTAKMAKADVPKNLDGMNLLPVLMSRRTEKIHKEFFWRQGNRAALRMGDWKLVRNGGRKQVAEWELYDLSTDLSEQQNQAAKVPDKLNELVERWETLNSEMKEPLFR